MERFDLTYLEEMSMGDKELIKEMIEIFCDQIPELIDDFDDYLVAYNYSGIASVAHKAKTSAATVGLVQLAEILRILEVNARKQIDTHEYPLYIEKFKEVSKNAVLELKDYVENLK